MKNLLLVITCTLYFFSACQGPKQQNPQQAATPEALEDKSFEFGLSKRSAENLVTELYKELAETTPELKALEKQLTDLANQKSDSLKPFGNYAGKNDSYYTAANTLLKTIQDSTLREKIGLQLNTSLKNYHGTIVNHESVLEAIHAKTSKLNDLHTMLMLIKTLPVIEAYQQSKLPLASTLSGILKKYNAAIAQTATLIKK